MILNTIRQFADELAAVEFAGITTRFDGIPKALREVELPAQWVELPRSLVSRTEMFSTLNQSGAQHISSMFIAVVQVTEGLSAAQRDAILDMAVRVEEWASTTPYTVTIDTIQRLKVANIEYRGLTVQVVSGDYV